MRETAVLFAQTSEFSVQSDILSQALGSMRISGSLLLNDFYAPPWAVEVPEARELAKFLNIRSDIRIAAFHLVQQGQVNLEFGNGDAINLLAGEMAVCFSGARHLLSQGLASNVLAFEDILRGSAGVFAASGKVNKSRTKLLCGIFLLQNTQLNPLFGALPELIQSSFGPSSDFSGIAGIADLLLREIRRQVPGNGYVVERLLELLCMDAIRGYTKYLPNETEGWLRALQDTVASNAISAIHLQPGKNWTVKSLAEHVSLSPSRFAARFTLALGEPPMAYVTKWRMYLAGQLLRNTGRSISNVALSVGYENVPAFSRTFKRCHGSPPGAWRSLHGRPD